MKVYELFEARDPALTYVEKQVKKVVDRVILELSGSKSGSMTRLMKRYERLDLSAKLLAERREATNLAIKDTVADLFDATDEVLTRVVETASFTITLSKAEKGADKKPKESVDYEAIVRELQIMVPELEEKIKDLTKKFTEITPAKDSPVSLRVRSNVSEGVIDSVLKTIKGFVKTIFDWTKSYDKRLTVLKAKL